MIQLHKLKESRMKTPKEVDMTPVVQAVRHMNTFNFSQKRWEGQTFKPVGNVVCVGIVVLSSGVARGGW